MDITLETAKEYLESQGCNLNSWIIDYDVIARYLVEYAKATKKDDKPKDNLL